MGGIWRCQASVCQTWWMRWSNSSIMRAPVSPNRLNPTLGRTCSLSCCCHRLTSTSEQPEASKTYSTDDFLLQCLSGDLGSLENQLWHRIIFLRCIFSRSDLFRVLFFFFLKQLWSHRYPPLNSQLVLLRNRILQKVSQQLTHLQRVMRLCLNADQLP